MEPKYAVCFIKRSQKYGLLMSVKCPFFNSYRSQSNTDRLKIALLHYRYYISMILYRSRSIFK